MLFKDFAFYLEKLEKTTSRNEMTEILADLFKKAPVEEIDKICYLSLGRLVPKFVGLEFQMAEKMLIRVLALAYEIKEETVKKEFKKKGDLGEVVAYLNKLKVEVKSLKVSDVYEKLMVIAKEAGEGSVERKINGLAGLLKSLDPLSAKYVVRIPLGRLRLGFSDMTILDALSWLVKEDKSGREELEKAYYVRPDVGELAKKVKKAGLAGAVGEVKPRLGVPVLPMLAQRLKSPKEMIKKMGKVAVEPKFDGLRVQVHVWQDSATGPATRHLHGALPANKLGSPPMESSGGRHPSPRGVEVRIFSRNLENITHMFPEVVDAVLKLASSRQPRASSLILDGEAVGVDSKSGKFLPFQETIQRKRKHGILAMTKKIPLKVFLFDVLFFNGKSLMDKNYLERRRVLEKIAEMSNTPVLQIVDYQLTQDPKEIGRLNLENRRKGLEGIIIKKLTSGYVPGRTGWRWVKMKEGEGETGKLADTLDCVVMGYYAGKGKRTTFGIGAFLVGVREVKSEKLKIKSFTEEKFLTIAKIGTGLTDEQWREMKAQGSRLKAQGKPKEYLVPEELTPDVWLVPEMVVEVAGDDLTKSPIHSSGYALRFPRLVAFREDKSPNEATSLEEVRKLFRMQ